MADESPTEGTVEPSRTALGRTAHVRWVRVLAFTVAFFLLCTIVAAVAIGLRVSEGFDAIRAGWTAYGSNVEPRAVYLNQIRGMLGFGGFVRRYRDYAENPDRAIRQAIEKDFADLQAVILNYEAIEISGREAEALAALRRVLERYANALEEIAAGGAVQGERSDRAFAEVFDERSAQVALDVLAREWARETGLAADRVDATVSIGLSVVKRGAVILPVLVAAGLLLLWLLRRLVNETTIRTRAEEVLRDSEERYRDLYANAPNAYYTVSADDGRIIRSNAAFARMLGWEDGDLEGRSLFDLFADTPQGLASAKQLFERFRAGETVRGVELQMAHKAGRVIWTSLTAEPVFDAEGRVVEVRSIDIDITDRKRAEDEIKAVQEELVRRANYDALTNLPNRTLLLDRLAQALIRAQRQRDKVAVLFIDLDRFKHVNDTHGHDAGDRLLQDAARRLRSCVREGDTVARLAGDEFVVVLSSIATTRDAATVAGKIVKVFSDDFVVNGRSEQISASVGIGIFPEHGRDLHSLLRNADAAMYMAKQAGRNRYLYYHPEVGSSADAAVGFGDNLRNALESGELSLLYQPVSDIRSNRIVGVEALLRWDSPVLGPVDPSRLIPVAEEQGTMIAIGEWVMAEACRNVAKWNRDPMEPDLAVSINVSTRQVSGGHILNSLTRALAATGLQAKRVELDITESLMIENDAEHLDILRKLDQLEVRLCLDDFGSGYASLMYLNRYPFRTVKIDQALIARLEEDAADTAMVIGIIQMAHSLGRIVVAEGVETQKQFDVISKAGCDRVQGNFISKPLAPSDIPEFLRSKRIANVSL